VAVRDGQADDRGDCERGRRVAPYRPQRRDRADADERIGEVLTLFPVLANRSEEVAANLSGGQQQTLALAMALLTRPRLLLIDELSLGLAPVVVEHLVETVRRVRDSGTTVVVVEQSVNLALTFAERAYFLEKGEVRFEGPAADLLERPDLLRSVYLQGAERGLGVRHDAPPRTHIDLRPEPDDHGQIPPALRVADLSVRFGGVTALDRVDLEVHPHEIVGLVGPNGAGKTTLFDVISGFLPDSRGRVWLGERELTTLSAPTRARHGLGRSFQDSRLFGSLTVHETVAVAFARSIHAFDPVTEACRLPARQITEAAVAARVDQLVEMLGLHWLRDRRVRELSTGQRRLVDQACVLAHRPTVVLLDEPSSGVAQHETEALVPLMRRIRDELGATLLVIDHDLALLTEVSDRLFALDQGRRITEGPAADVLAHPHVVASYLGVPQAPPHSEGARSR
jgi:branched-chain amino acid transport system ATP-binding protein